MIEHPYFQRLRRITQMGLSNMVYPGANHTRFHHAIGCVNLMQKVVSILRVKGVKISDEEENALYIAILLHDIGHGPFSHALERSIVNGISHEKISLMFMEEFNTIFDGKLEIAIQLFINTYHRTFLHQLISSQLDIDRLDYLKRDSFYTGVVEGNISSDRIIAMMDVVNDELVVEAKAIYSVEKFIVARRLMYWQVYLHKTSLVAENMIIKLFQRARELTERGEHVKVYSSLDFFLTTKISTINFTREVLQEFSKLDDVDVFFAIKMWLNHPDRVLSILSKMIFYRKFLKIEMKNNPIKKEVLDTKIRVLKKTYGMSDDEAKYFVFSGKISNLAYDKKQPVKIINEKGKPEDIITSSNQLNLQALTEPVVKYFVCYPKKML
ncbi:MAG: HD domain-containing protein [Flavobacteriaceae bacterium]|nr:MAG: HD domain-containing protein [Flavobacteriaceae bacterium]